MRNVVRSVTLIGAVVVAAASVAAGVTVEQLSPQGTVKGVRQITARFSEPMVPFGDLRDVAAPFTIACPAEGTARWVDSRTWAYDFKSDLPAGIRCELTVRPDLRSLDGEPVTGQTEFAFSTGGPAIIASLPGEGARIEEAQAFVLTLDGEATPDSVLAHVGFDVEGVAERVGVALVEGDAREQILTGLPAWLRPDGHVVVLTARQAFPNKAGVRLVWGPGVASPSGVATEQDQVLAYTVRPPFTATVTCERENARAGCIPLTPIRVRLSAPVPSTMAARVTLAGDGTAPRSPRPPDEPSESVSTIEFAPPFPESTRLHVIFPDDFVDDAGRSLATRDPAELTVQTGPLPPLAKFAARFGILEAHADPALPITIRNLDPQTGGQQLTVIDEPAADWRERIRGLYDRLTGNVARVPPQAPEQILPWLRRLATARRAASVFAGATLPEGRALEPFTLPQPAGPSAFQVVGIPLPTPGLYVVEIASPRLGAALLDTPQPMYVPAAALVTNLAVHLQWARENALVWVTTLDGARPVGDARILVQDCNGTVLGTAVTDSNGIARLAGLPDEEHAPRCYREESFSNFDDFDYREYFRDAALNGLDGGLFVIAQTDGDLSFVHSSWQNGIEPWRFRLPAETWTDPLIVHTVFDRPLFRAGETVHMKHVLRHKAMAGFAIPPPAEQPGGAVIRHLGSDEQYELPLAWDTAAGVAEQEWTIPAGAKLGQYDVLLKHGDTRIRSGSFRVEQFRVPLMKATLQLPPQAQVGAAEVPVDMTVHYLAGGAAAGLPVTLRAQVRDREPPRIDALEHASVANGTVREGTVRHSEAEEEADDATAQGMLSRQALTLDEAGAARTQIGEIPAVDRVRELLAELEYRDPNGELQTVAATVPLWPASRLPAVDVEHWAGTPGTISARIAVIDADGRPATDVPVQVELFRRRFYSHRKRLVGGFYGYEHVEETERIGDFCATRTDARGMAECRGRAPADGELIVQATVTDQVGRSASAHESVFVSGEDEWGFAVDASDRIDVLPEKPQYEPGETARFQARMPFRRATALVTIQREGVGDARVLPLARNNPVIEIPVDAALAPNAFVSVLLVRGRVADVQPTAMVDLGKPAFKLGVAEIRVGWRAHALDVGVTTDRPVYRVRETATVRLRVRTADGSAPPPGSEVALAAVDEGLLELMPNTSWNLLQAMMGRRGYGVRTATAQMQVIGRRHFGRKALPTGGGGGRQSTRELFDTLLLWRGRVPLDDAGEATVEVPLNDSLTSFRIAAVATAGSGEFGTGTAEIRSTQDLMLLSGLAPIIREGDVAPAPFTVRNTTERPLEVTVRAAVDGLAADLPPQTLQLAAGESRLVEWMVTAPPLAATLRYVVEASAPDGPSDRLAVTQRVLPAVPVRTVQATLVRLEPSLRMPVELPDGALPDRGSVDVAATASLAGTLAPLEQWLHQYPYTCLEQQISVAVGTGDRARWDAIAATLPSYLDGDGLLKFFPPTTAGSEVLTAYVVAITNAAGWPLPAAVKERVTNGLRAFVEGSLQRDSPIAAPDLVVRKLAAIDALTRLEAATPQMLDSITIEPNLWPTSAVLDWWSILERLPAIPDRDVWRRAAEQIVRARLNVQGTTMGFSTDDADRLWWLMSGPDTNAVRLIHLLVEHGFWRDEVPRLVRGAIGRQRRGIWDTTVANAWGAVALRAFGAAYEAAPVAGTTTVTLGSAAEQIDWTHPPPPLSLPWPDGRGELVIDHRGSGTPWVTVTSRAAIPLRAPLASGYRVRKTVTPLDPRAAGELHVGDRLQVRLEIDADSDMTWVVVNDPIPAGASHLGTGLARDSAIDTAAPAADLPPTFAERRFDAYVAYYGFVPKGTFTTEYTIRLNQSGHYELPPTRVEALYAPEMFGELPNQPLEVEP